MAHWHDFNPWADRLVYVPDLYELAECVAHGTIHILAENKTVPYTPELAVEHWLQHGPRVDAYILPQPSGNHSIGIRYGAEGSEYFSPHNAKPHKTQALLDKYGSK